MSKVAKNILSCLLFVLAFPLMSCNHLLDDDEPCYKGKPSENGQLYDRWNNITLPDYDAPELTSIETDCEIYDNINDTTWNYNVILPPSYNSSPDKTYPVLYFLHGKDGNYKNGINSFKTNNALDYCYYHIDNFPEIIVVMPDAANTYYVDYYQDNIKYETFFFSTFIPEIEKLYRISKKRDERMIGGFSMGGYGAAYYATKYNDLFCFAHCMSTPLDGKGVWQIPPILDVIHNSGFANLPFYIFDIGLNDSFICINQKVIKELMELKINHKYIERPGAHNSQFWRESIFICLNEINYFLTQ